MPEHKNPKAISIPQNTKAVILGCYGETLSSEEFKFFKNSAAKPFGLILFARNCKHREQLLRLIAQFREAVGWKAPIFIDQEGGVNQRLTKEGYGETALSKQQPNKISPSQEISSHRVKPETATAWPLYPPISILGQAMHKNYQKAQEASYLMGLALGATLFDLGINVNLAPMLDLRHAQSHALTFKRSFHEHSFSTAMLGRHQIQGMLDAGVLPTMKHIPGHGRATLDSHTCLPEITSSISVEQMFLSDFYPFRFNADCPVGMLAHIRYSSLSALPASQSKAIIQGLLREDMNIDSLLLSDCIFMEALKGPLATRGLACLEAGVDIVIASHGNLEDKDSILKKLPNLSSEAARRYNSALTKAKKSRAYALKYSAFPLHDYGKINELFFSSLNSIG